jgi:hypothetical protein
MATNPKVFESSATSDKREDFDSVIARVLLGARERIQAEMQPARELGIIDEDGNRISKEWPAEMRPPTPSSTGAPLDPDDYDWQF